jgi:uncharacterized membrane protein
MSTNILVRGLLLVSLVANAFLVGILAGHSDHRLHFGGNPDHGHHGPLEAVDHMTRGMSADDAQIVKDAFAAREPGMHVADQTMQEFPDRLRQILDAPVLDTNALTQTLVGARDMHDAEENVMIAAFVDAASKISADGRKKLSIDHGPARAHP